MAKAARRRPKIDFAGFFDALIKRWRAAMIAHTPPGHLVKDPRKRKALVRPATKLKPRAPPQPRKAVAAAPVQVGPPRQTLRQLGGAPPTPRQLNRQVQLAADRPERSAADTAIVLASAISSHRASRFRFTRPDGAVAGIWDSGPAVGGSSAGLAPDDEQAYWDSLRARLARDIGREPADALDAAWLANHHRWIVWKLACQQRCFASALGAFGFGPAAVLRQLQSRYEREIVRKKVSVLQRIADAVDVAGTHMVLCVATVHSREGVVELTDGWRSVWATCDAPLLRQLRRDRFPIGIKLRIFGTELVVAPIDKKAGTDDETEELDPRAEVEVDSALPRPTLHLRANGVRRAAWDAKLGKERKRMFRVALGSLVEGGGAAPSVHVRIERRYGPRALVKPIEGDGPAEWFTAVGYEEKVHADFDRARALEERHRSDDAAPSGRQEPAHPTC